GIYGLVAFLIIQSRREMGIRMTLGASPVDVLWQVTRGVLLASVVGVAAGVVLAIGLGHFIAGLLFEFKPADPTALVVAGFLGIGVATLAAYLPAKHATCIDPAAVLR